MTIMSYRAQTRQRQRPLSTITTFDCRQVFQQIVTQRNKIEYMSKMIKIYRTGWEKVCVCDRKTCLEITKMPNRLRHTVTSRNTHQNTSPHENTYKRNN